MPQYALLVVTSIPATATLAQSFEGQGFDVGEARLIPEIRIDYVATDNAFRSNDDEVDATGVIVAPFSEL